MEFNFAGNQDDQRRRMGLTAPGARPPPASSAVFAKPNASKPAVASVFCKPQAVVASIFD